MLKLVVTLTVNPTIDVSTSVERVTPNQKLRCESPHREPGGGGINVARAASNLGARSLAVWTSGGHVGQLLADLLDHRGQQHLSIPIAGETRENIMVTETGSGQQYRFGMPGPSLTEEDQEQCIRAVRELTDRSGILVLSGSLPPGMPADFYGRVVRDSRWEGRVALDTSGVALEAGLEAGVYLVKPNLRELGALVGRPVESDEDIRAAAQTIVATGKAEVVVASVGAGGAHVVTANRAWRIHSPTVPIRSRVGAGDSMVAGMVTALSRGESLGDAARFGVAAGSAAVMTPGTELCGREDTERLAREMGSREP